MHNDEVSKCTLQCVSNYLQGQDTKEAILHNELSHVSKIQLNLVIRNFLVTLTLFLNAKCSLFSWSKLKIGHCKWFLNTNLFLIKTFLITKFECTTFPAMKVLLPLIALAYFQILPSPPVRVKVATKSFGVDTSAGTHVHRCTWSILVRMWQWK
jgi:hypothetical protein